MPELHALLPVLVVASVGLIVLSIGLRASVEHALYLFRRPALLARAILAMYVIVPVVATLVVLRVHLVPPVAAAIVLMSVSPIPPILPVTQTKVGGHQPYVLGLLVAVSVLAIAFVPLCLVVLSHIFPADAYLPATAVARVIFTTILVPLGIGIVVGRAAPALAARIAPAAGRIGTLLLLLALLVLLAASAPKMAALVGNGSLLAIAVVCAASLAAGHFLGGPDPANESSLALASLMRHPGIALAIAKASFPDVQVGAAILLYLIVAILVGVPYRRWARRRDEAAGVLAGSA
jgi:BASS family bile acid:Na+ symporter